MKVLIARYKCALRVHPLTPSSTIKDFKSSQRHGFTYWVMKDLLAGKSCGVL